MCHSSADHATPLITHCGFPNVSWSSQIWPPTSQSFHKAKERQLGSQGSINTCDTAVHRIQMFRQVLFSWKEGDHIIARSTAPVYCVCPVSRSWVPFHPQKNLIREILLLSIPLSQVRSEAKNSDLPQISPARFLFNPRNSAKGMHCWWDCKMMQPLWNAVWRFLKMLNGIILSPSNSTPRYAPSHGKRYVHIETYRYTRFVAALFIIAKHRNHPNVQQLTNGHINYVLSTW